MKFIAHNSMKQAPAAEVMALFPAEQARVAELMAQGVLESLYVAADFRLRASAPKPGWY